ncbi:MAG: site-specific DNA-methyltransferase [Muribaculaceae bacterium]|nr:site-specific DNA-methyltransferase [Muribaculaceae bacterium]
MKATDRHKLIDRIKTLDGLTDDERSALLGLLRETKTYGLVWEDKPEAIEERLRDELPVLVEVKDRALTEAEPNAPNHILIEGDNLEALTTLAYTHAGKIDVIYIDPPYNTGNKDFIYNDSYVDTDDSYRHSKWLSFMSRRLRIAKKLLSDRGVIFISIDDNEFANLRLLFDDIFGENNFLSNLLWQSTPGSNTGTDIKTVTEYVLLFSRKKESAAINSKPIENYDKYTLLDEFVETRGPYITNKLDRRMTGSHYSEALNYGIDMPDGSILFPGGETFSQPFWNWRWSKSKVEWGKQNGFLLFSKKNGKWVIYFKQYLKVDNNNNPIERSHPYQNLILEDAISSARGTKEVMDLFSEKKFDYPKPLNLLRTILQMSGNKDSLYLDFFAGSGTTLHAVMQLNAEDGGKRLCILCTNNENGICENITYERNKRVIEGYTKPNGEFVEGLHNNNLRYYKTDFVGRSRTMRNMQRLVNLSTDMLCIKENLYMEKKSMGEVKTHPQIFRYFDDGKKQMLIIYREEYIEEIVGIIEKMDIKNPMKVYVFSPSEDPASELFETVADKVETTALPAAIYNAYKRVLPKPKDKPVGTHGSVVRESGMGTNEYPIEDNEELGGLFAAEGGEE